MTIPRQVTSRSCEGLDFQSLNNRITALENSTTAVPGNPFFTKHFGVHVSQLANYLRNLQDRVAALESSSTQPVHFDLKKLPRRAPLGKTLYDLNHRVVALGG
jgi:hypothetical protein